MQFGPQLRRSRHSPLGELSADSYRQDVLELIVGVVCLIGIIGTIFPVIPGAFLCVGAVIVWAAFTGGHAWWVAAAAVVIVVVATVMKYLIPARALKSAGVPSFVLIVGGICGIVGFFLIPVVGLPIGFILGVYLAELARLRSVSEAWPTTWTAMKAAGISMVIDLYAAMLITAIWFAVVLGLWVT